MRHRVQLDGRGLAFEADDDRSLLDSAEAAGLRLPWGCRVGACLNCAARLVAGKVAMPGGSALTQPHLRQGVFLPCIARPLTDLRIEVGDAMGVLDVPPWME